MERCVLTPTHVEDDQSSMGDPYVDQHMLKKIQQVRGDPYWWVKKRSTKLISELSHAVVKEAEHLRVQELVKKIESHPH